MSVKIVEVDVDNEGRRLDNYLISYLKDIPKSKIYKIIRKGEIRVNSSRAKPDRKIKNGDLIRIPPNLNITKTSIKSINIKQLENLKEKIIYEDKNYIVINKDAGIAVHGGSKNYIGIIDIARKIYGRNISINLSKEISNSDEYVEIINRMGTLKAQGFQNLDYDGKIFFKGKVEFVISK